MHRGDGEEMGEGDEGMTYVLCCETECVHHDGDGCTLEEIDLTGSRTLVPYCADWKQDEEGWYEHAWKVGED